MSVKDSLINAVHCGELQRVRELIDSHGLSNSKHWTNGYFLLCDALMRHHTAVAKLLLTSGSKVNKKYWDKKPSNSPLHLAVRMGDIEIIQLILDRGGYVDAKDSSGKTPLLVAAEVGNIEAIELFRCNGANIDDKDNEGRNILHIAAARGWVQIFQCHFKYQTYINSKCSIGYTPLHYAAGQSTEEFINLLLSNGANVDAEGEDGITPLHIAAKKGYIHNAENLLNNGACINSLTIDGYTPIHFATERNDKKVVKLLLDRDADIDASTKDNETLLHIATKKRYSKVVELLLQHGAKVDSLDKEGKTILYHAIEKTNFRIAQKIIKYYPDINNKSNKSALNDDARTFVLLYSAVQNGCLKAVEYLLKYWANVNTLQNSEGSTAKNKLEELVNLFATYAPAIVYNNLNLDDNHNIRDSLNLLNIAVKKGFVDIVEALLQHGADTNARDINGRTALHFAALTDIKSMGQIAKLILRKGANVDAEDKSGLTALDAAIRKENSDVVEALLDYNANVNCGINGVTPLYYSAKKGNSAISTMLLNKGANVNANLKDESTPLHVAAYFGHKAVVQTLLKHGANIDCKTVSGIWNMNSRGRSGETALHVASCIEIVSTLLEYGADINIADETNSTPLRRTIIQMINYQRLGLESKVAMRKMVAEALVRHIVRMKAANLYVSKENLKIIHHAFVTNFCVKCEKEIAIMKSEKINNSYISFFDILAKTTHSLGIYMRKENIVQHLKSVDYKTKFPIYGVAMGNRFRKVMVRKELIDQANKIFHFFFKNVPELPYELNEKILSYLSEQDLEMFMDPVKFNY